MRCGRCPGSGGGRKASGGGAVAVDHALNRDQHSVKLRFCPLSRTRGHCNENQSNPSGRWNPHPAGLRRGFQSVPSDSAGCGRWGPSPACGFPLPPPSHETYARSSLGNRSSQAGDALRGTAAILMQVRGACRTTRLCPAASRANSQLYRAVVNDDNDAVPCMKGRSSASSTLLT